MKISFISDLHVDLNPRASIQRYHYELVELIKTEGTDLLVIGGDISNHYETTISFVENLQKNSEIPIYFIPGNHDFWEESVDKDTWGIYKIYKNHPQSLLESPLQLTNEYSLVGHTAWYNHAVYDKKKYSEAEIEEGKFRWSYWQDKLNMNWKMTDQELSLYFANLIKKDLDRIKTNSIILQTHVVTIPEFTMPMPHQIFDFFNAYMSTDDLDTLQEDYPISHHFMGHIHIRAQIKKNQSQYISNSLGYRREWRTKNLTKELKDSLITIEI